MKVSTKYLKSGKETKIDVMVMENLLFGRNITRIYDLKGSSRSRYNPDLSGNNKVLLDQNLIDAMPTSPIFVSNKAKRLLERAVWNDTSFLAVSSKVTNDSVYILESWKSFQMNFIFKCCFYGFSNLHIVLVNNIHTNLATC